MAKKPKKVALADPRDDRRYYTPITLRLKDILLDDLREDAAESKCSVEEIIERDLIRGDSGWISWDKLNENLRQLDGFVKRVIERGEASERVLEQYRVAERLDIMKRLKESDKIRVHGKTSRKRKSHHYAAKADRRAARKRKTAR